MNQRKCHSFHRMIREIIEKCFAKNKNTEMKMKMRQLNDLSLQIPSSTLFQWGEFLKNEAKKFENEGKRMTFRRMFWDTLFWMLKTGMSWFEWVVVCSFRGVDNFIPRNPECFLDSFFFFFVWFVLYLFSIGIFSFWKGRKEKRFKFNISDKLNCELTKGDNYLEVNLFISYHFLFSYQCKIISSKIK